MKSFTKTCLVMLAALTMTAFAANAQTSSATTTTNSAPVAAKPRPKPYAGTIASVDADAKTITVTLANGNSQVLHIGSKTKIKKDMEPATLADAAAGQKVRGSMHKNDAGDWVANTVNIGQTKKAAAPAAAPPADAK
jgi:hypothetical protein